MSNALKLDRDEEIWDPPGLAAFLKVDRSWIYRQVELNHLPAFRVGKYLRFRKSSVLAWIDAQNAK